MKRSSPSYTRREFLRQRGAGIAALALLSTRRPLAASAGKLPEPDLDLKIGQMILAGFRGYKLKDKNSIEADLEERYLGGVVLNANELLPDEQSYHRYNGSLTAPRRYTRNQLLTTY